MSTTFFAFLTLDILLIFSLIGASTYLYLKLRKIVVAKVALNEIANASDFGMVLFDTEGAFVRVNERAQESLPIFESDPLSLTQTDFLNYVYDHAADHDDAIEGVFSDDAQERDVQFREVIITEHGIVFLVGARSLSSGMTLFTLVDVSVVQRSEQNAQKLHKINKQLMQAIQAATSGIVISDPKEDDNNILFVNRAFCDFIGCEYQDIIGQTWEVLLPYFIDGDGKDSFVEALSHAKHTEMELTSDKDEKKRHFNMKLSPVLDEKGGLDLFIGVVSEITLLKQREAEFFQAQKLESLGQLAAGVAHDFNNILSIIGGYTVMSKSYLDDRDKILSYLDKIDSAAQRGAGLTQKMLTFSRHKVVASACINVCDIVQEQKVLLSPLIGAQINYDILVPDEDVNIQGTEDSLGQIVMNLVINARDAMPEGGDIKIGVSCPDVSDVPLSVSQGLPNVEYVQIWVRDTGTGMDSETVARIFDPFFSTKEQGKGTGLGLSVVYGLVKEMGGLIHVESELGAGTTLSVFFPRSYEERTKQITGDSTDAKSISLQGYTVLLAEDEPDLLDLVKCILEELGLTVLTASNGNEALHVQDEHEGELDLLLTDVVMPEMNGVKLAELLTALRPETKVVYMSGYPAHGDMAPVSIPEGAIFVAKPVDYSLIAQVLFKTLSNQIGAGGEVGIDGVAQWKNTASEKHQEGSS